MALKETEFKKLDDLVWNETRFYIWIEIAEMRDVTMDRAAKREPNETRRLYKYSRSPSRRDSDPLSFDSDTILAWRGAVTDKKQQATHRLT